MKNEEGNEGKLTVNAALFIEALDLCEALYNTAAGADLKDAASRMANLRDRAEAAGFDDTLGGRWTWFP